MYEESGNTQLQEDVYIVAIGASAGGLEALQLFVQNIEERDVAYVVVQHLSSDFESLMPELLAKHTDMPIVTISSGQRVEPGYIFLMPKEQNVIVEAGRFVLVDKNPTLNLPIDLFFDSAARFARERCIGVVLSGTGTDGSRGIKSISENGGFVMAQLPESAGFDGMPNAAINTGETDYIQRPEDIPETVSMIVNREFKIAVNDEEEAEEDPLVTLLDEVCESTGMNFSNWRKQTIQRRLQKRMLLQDCTSIEEYIQRVRTSDAEAQGLAEDFLIGVTNFFRDRTKWRVVKEVCCQQIFGDRGRKEPARFWVAGCSTGEEAYTLAMVIENYFRDNEIRAEYKIFATDLNSKAIEFAGRGIYSDSACADLSAEELDNYFVRVKAGYRVSEQIRQRVVFSSHDLLADPPFIDLDMATCRNLLIYLEPHAQQHVIETMMFAIRTGGYLYLGSSESPGEDISHLEQVDAGSNLYKVKQRLRGYSARGRHMRVVERSRRAGRVVTAPAVVGRSHYDQMIRSKFAPACVLVSPDLNIVYSNGPVNRFLNHPETPGDSNLALLTNEDAAMVFADGVRRAQETQKAVSYRGVKFSHLGKPMNVNLRFHPDTDVNTAEELVWVEFSRAARRRKPSNDEVIEAGNLVDNQQNQLLKRELRETRLKLQTTREQLSSANEELQASNEELQASNEELQSTNEELQSVNEELYTVNTELEQKISQLSQASQDIEQLLNGTGIGTILLDEQLNVRLFTPVVTKNFSLQTSDIGRPLKDFANTIGGPVVAEQADKALASGKDLEREVSDGRGNHYLLRLMPHKHKDGKIAGAIITITDVTTIKKQHRDLELANQYLDNFVAAASHDLRAPVTNLVSLLSLYDEASSDQGLQADIITKTTATVAKLKDILDGFIELAEVQRTNDGFDDIVDLNQAADDALGEVDFFERDIELEKSLSVPTIRGNASLCRVALRNLFSNAAKHSPGDGPAKIEIGTEVVNDAIRLWVRDHGKGIDLNEQPVSELLQPFVTGNNDSVAGTGIGLHLVNLVAEKMGGYVTLDSRPNYGTTVSMAFPAVTESSSA